MLQQQPAALRFTLRYRSSTVARQEGSLKALRLPQSPLVTSQRNTSTPPHGPPTQAVPKQGPHVPTRLRLGQPSCPLCVRNQPAVFSHCQPSAPLLPLSTTCFLDYLWAPGARWTMAFGLATRRGRPGEALSQPRSDFLPEPCAMFWLPHGLRFRPCAVCSLLSSPPSQHLPKHKHRSCHGGLLRLRREFSLGGVVMSQSLCGVSPCPRTCVRVCHCPAGRARASRLLAQQAVRRFQLRSAARS